MTDNSRADELDSMPITATGHRRGLKRKAQAIIRDLEDQLAAKDRRIETLQVAIEAWRATNAESVRLQDTERARADALQNRIEELERRALCFKNNCDIQIAQTEAERARADKAEADAARATERATRTEYMYESRVDEMSRELAKWRDGQEHRELLEDWNEEKSRADKAEAELLAERGLTRGQDVTLTRVMEKLRIHLLEASDVGQLQERLTATLQDKDVAEAERDEARRELIVQRVHPELRINWESTVREMLVTEADREWGQGEGSRLFPEEADRG